MLVPTSFLSEIRHRSALWLGWTARARCAQHFRHDRWTPWNGIELSLELFLEGCFEHCQATSDSLGSWCAEQWNRWGGCNSKRNQISQSVQCHLHM